MNHEELVEALRCKRDDCEGCDLAFFDKDEGWMCQYAAKDDDAAAAIEALQAEVKILKVSGREAYFDGLAAGAESKRGEWIGKSDDDSLVKCSVCGHIRIGSSLWYCKQYVPYCENCGAKMEVQE